MLKPINYILTILLGLLTTLVLNAQQQGGGNNSNNSTDTEMLTHIFSTLDGTKTKTGYLWDKTGYPEVLDSAIFKHTREAKYALSTKIWNAYAEAVEFANVDRTRMYASLPAATPLQRADSNLVDFRMMAVKVDKIKSTAFEDNLLSVDTVNNHIYDLPNPSESPYEEKTIFLASLSHQTVFGKTVYFRIDENLLIGNLTPEEKDEFFGTVQIAFGDCNGTMPVLRNDIVAYTYPDYGTRRLKIKATVNGKQMESHFLLTLSSATSSYQDNTGAWQDPPIISYLPPTDPVCGDGYCNQGEIFFCEVDCGVIIIPRSVNPKDDCEDELPEIDAAIDTRKCDDVVYGRGSGRTGCTRRIGDDLIAAAKWDYEIAPRRNFQYRRSGGHNNLEGQVRAGAYIFLSADNILNRPVILLDGYAMIDECGYSVVGETGNRFNDFTNELLDRGYDVIYLNYEYIGNYIENNAAILSELLQDVNEAKLQNAAEYGVPIEQNVVLGFSLGGIISRYELARMETENIDHDTRLYISVDTPHKGANIPLGIQHAGGYVNEIYGKFPRYLPGILDVTGFTRKIVITLGIAFRVLDSQWFPISGQNGQERFPPLWRNLAITSDFLEQTHGDHAAQQYLKYHTFHDVSRPNPEYEALQNEFLRMGQLLGNTGYPTCEKVAIINGDARGRNTIDNPLDPDDLGLEAKEGLEFLDFDAQILGRRTGTQLWANLNFSPVIPQQRQRVSFFQMRKFWFGLVRDTYTRQDEADPRAAYDLAPGSFIRTDVANGLQQDIDIFDQEWLNIFEMETIHQPDHFTFVPSVSAADINMPNGNHDNNLYLNYSLTGNATYPQVVDLTTFNVVNSNVCPFDRVYPSNSLINRRLRNGSDRDNLTHGESDILVPNIEDFDGNGTRENRFLDNHFPRLPVNVAEFYNLNANNIRFEQEDIRTDCDRQFVRFELVLVNGEDLPTCPENTRYNWFIDGVFATTSTRPFYAYDVPEAEIPTLFTPITINHTVRVEIEKRQLAGNWVQVANISDTYFIGYDEPPYDCNGNEFGLGKMAVEKNISELVIYPNPAKTQINIKSPIKIQNVEISNGLGQIVLSKNTDTQKVDLNTGNLSKGIYFVKILLEDNSLAIKKLIIN